MVEKPGEVRLHMRIWQEDGEWMGECPEISVVMVTDENTKASVIVGLCEAVAMMVEVLEEEGQLENRLQEGVQRGSST